MLSPGTIVSGYRVDGVLGDGGMGVVYRATQLSLNRTVALKVLASELSDDAAFRERFRREGLLQAAIDHEHIVTVYEAGSSEEGLFLAMRLIRGPTLKDMVLAGDLEPHRALAILTQVADALDSAHDVGLTHRDIKPQNILIGANDHAYLADFGLTQASDEVSLTETGQFIGTIDYVAPEQVQGQGATARSDVYSLTAVLYEALTGAVPFPRQNEAAVLYAHISEAPPSITERVSDLPPLIDAVVARGMAKAPADRYPSAGELMADARAAFGAEPAAVTTMRPRANPAGTSAAATTMRGGVVAGAGAVTAPAAAVTAPASPQPAAAPTTVAAPPQPAAPARRRGALTGGAVALLIGLGIAAAAGGYLAASGGNSADSASEAFGNSASAGTIGLSFPSGWTRVAGFPSIPGVSFEDPLVLAAAGQRQARLVAGQVSASGPTLLPRSLMGRLAGDTPEGQAVRLGEVEGLRYRVLTLRGSDARLQIFAVPTNRGVATIACTAPAGARAAGFLAECESVATSLKLTGAKPYPLGPSQAYARTVSGAMATLERARRAAAAKLRGADTTQKQAAAAAALAAAYRTAARRLDAAEVSPADAAGNAALVGALQGTASAYARAAEGARGNDAGAYSAAAGAVKRAQAELQGALSGLERLGYVLP